MSFGGISSGDIAEAGLGTFTSLDTDAFALRRESEEFGQFGLTRKTPSFTERTADLTAGETEVGSFREVGRRGGSVIRGSARELQADVDALRGEIGTTREGFGDILAETEALRTDFQELADQVTPGFGRLTAAARNSIRDAASREAGDLRAQFARRKLSGSQFAINEQRRLALDFAIEEEEAVAEAFTEELELSQGILNDMASLLEIETEVGQLEIDSFLADAEALAIKLGASELEAESYKLELDALISQAQTLKDAAVLELEELAISGDIINGVSATTGSIAAADASSSTSGWEIFADFVPSVGLSFATGGAGSAVGAAGAAVGG